MIVNQALGITGSANRPASASKASPAETGPELPTTAIGAENADKVAVNAQRLIVSENLNASEALIPDRGRAGGLMDMLKRQLEFNPAEAMDAQAGNLAASATRLLTE